MPLHSSPQSGHVIQDETTPLTARAALNFTGAGVTATDNAGTGATDVSISGAGVSDASTSVKGVTKMSVAPVSASAPIAVGDNDKRIQPQVTGTAAGNLGTAQTITFTGAEEQWLIGVLNGNLAVTVSNPVAGSRLKVLALQDGTGGRTLTIAGTAVTIATTATTGLAMVTADWVDATNFRIESAGVFTESDPNAVLKSTVTTAGDLIVATGNAAVTRLGKGADGTVLKMASGSVGWGADTGFANPMTTSGDTIYGGASGAPTRLAKGSDGNVLTLASGLPSWAAPSGGGGSGAGGLPFAAGQAFVPPQYIGSTNSTYANGTAIAVPFKSGRTCTLTSADFQIQTGGGTGAKLRIAIYDDAGGYPGNLLGTETGAITATGTGATTGTISANVTSGSVYWIVQVQQGASGGDVALKGTNVPGFNPLVPIDPSNMSGVGIKDNGSGLWTGAMPSTGGSAGNWSVTAPAPTIALLAAA